MQHLLLVFVLLLTMFSLPAPADSHFQLWKVWAGAQVSRRAMQQSARSSVRKGIVVADISEIECKKKFKIDIAFYVIPQQIRYVSYDYTWSHPGNFHEDGGTDHTYSKVIRRGLEKISDWNHRYELFIAAHSSMVMFR